MTLTSATPNPTPLARSESLVSQPDDLGDGLSIGMREALVSVEVQLCGLQRRAARRMRLGWERTGQGHNANPALQAEQAVPLGEIVAALDTRGRRRRNACFSGGNAQAYRALAHTSLDPVRQLARVAPDPTAPCA
jgi:hypothetical protein